MFDLYVSYPSSTSEIEAVMFDTVMHRVKDFLSMFPDGIVHFYGPLTDLAKGVK